MSSEGQSWLRVWSLMSKVLDSYGYYLFAKTFHTFYYHCGWVVRDYPERVTLTALRESWVTPITMKIENEDLKAKIVRLRKVKRL